MFAKKYFDTGDRMTILELGQIFQKADEPLEEYVKRFRDKVLECCDTVEEKSAVQVCIK